MLLEDVRGLDLLVDVLNVVLLEEDLACALPMMLLLLLVLLLLLLELELEDEEVTENT